MFLSKACLSTSENIIKYIVSEDFAQQRIQTVIKTAYQKDTKHNSLVNASKIDDMTIFDILTERAFSRSAVLPLQPLHLKLSVARLSCPCAASHGHKGALRIVAGH